MRWSQKPGTPNSRFPRCCLPDRCAEIHGLEAGHRGRSATARVKAPPMGLNWVRAVDFYKLIGAQARFAPKCDLWNRRRRVVGVQCNPTAQRPHVQRAYHLITFWKGRRGVLRRPRGRVGNKQRCSPSHSSPRPACPMPSNPWRGGEPTDPYGRPLIGRNDWVRQPGDRPGPSGFGCRLVR